MLNFKTNNNTILGIWLFILTLMVYLIILIGGLTRLTESGLSMVDWRPLLGIIPPLNEKDWIEVFEQYKKTPEYIIVNSLITLNEFKYIFWWEYFHRLFARLIGFVFIIPFFYFLIKNSLSRKILFQLVFVFIFGALQAAVGWWMVKSGLNNDPYVSQYRLSFHLLNALIILGILFWMTLDHLIKKPKNFFNLNIINNLLTISLIFCLLTIISGSFVAGTDAGKSFNTFPLMGGKLIPDGYLLIEDSIIINFFENTIAIQFNHRWIAIFTFVWTVIVITFALLKQLDRIQKIACYIVIIFITSQILFGILTLINNVPIILASIHQANAVLLYCSLLFTLYMFPKKV